jgi:hypothetical protein
VRHKDSAGEAVVMHELILRLAALSEHVCLTVTFLCWISVHSYFLDIISYPLFPRKILSGINLAQVHQGAKLGVNSMGKGGGDYSVCRNGLGARKIGNVNENTDVNIPTVRDKPYHRDVTFTKRR